MSLFTNLIKKHIKSSGYTIYSISYHSNINRTTLQKILSEQRKMTQEIYQKILPFLHLTPSELDELNAAFLIEQIGEQRYVSHMYIKKLMETPLHESTKSLALTYNEEHKELKIPETFIVSGNFQVLQSICRLLTQDYSNCPNPYFYSYVSFQNQNICTLQKHINDMNINEISIKYLIEFSKINNMDDNYDNLFNLKNLATLIPTITACCGSYTIYYYYSHDTTKNTALALPYYIITNSFVVLVSKDFDSAVFINNKDIHDYYYNNFINSTNESNILTNGLIPSTALLEYLIANDSTVSSPICLSSQPSIEAFLDSRIIDKYMYPTEAKDYISKRLLFRIEQLNTTTHQTTLFTLDGLKMFAYEGRCYNFPDELYKPIDITDRIEILKKIIASNQGHVKFLALNENKFPVNIGLSIVPVYPDSILIVIRTNQQGFSVINLKENTLFKSIVDFIANIISYDLTYSTEETNHIIQEIIDNLSENLQKKELS